MNTKDFKQDDYKDIIDMPRHVSKNHPPMSMLNRAAQFAPFAALNGFEEKLKETELNYDKNTNK